MPAVPESRDMVEAPVALPMVRVLALAPVPRFTAPVVPESRVSVEAAALDMLVLPLPVSVELALSSVQTMQTHYLLRQTTPLDLP